MAKLNIKQNSTYRAACVGLILSMTITVCAGFLGYAEIIMFGVLGILTFVAIANKARV